MTRLARLVFAIGCAVGASVAKADRLYVSSLSTDEVLLYDSVTGAYQSTLISSGLGGLAEPHGILDRGTDLLVASFANDRVLRYDRATGAFLGIFINGAGGLDAPTYIAPGPDGNLYVSSQNSDQILRYSPVGAFIDAFVSAGSGGLDGPSGFAFGPDGRFYVAGRYSANVLAYTGTTGAFIQAIATSADGLGAGSTFGLEFDSGGDLYFASNGSVFRYSLVSTSLVASVPAGFPIGLERGPDGQIVVATSNNLRRYNRATNTLSGFLLSGGTISTLNFFHDAGGPCRACRGDFNFSGHVDAGDVLMFVARLLGGAGLPCADLNGDGAENGRDVPLFLSAATSETCGGL